MRTLPDINILQTSNNIGSTTGTKSGNGKGKDIFQSILNSLSGKNIDNSWVSTLYSDTSEKSSLNAGLAGKNLARNRLTNNKHNIEDMIVPASLQNHLLVFLEKQGFSLKDINQALSASKNSNGFVQLDKLLEGLSGINAANNTKMLVGPFKETFSSFLKEQGIEPNNFGTFFSSLEDKNSVLKNKIDDLLTGSQKEKSFIESSHIPRVQELLFKMGLGVGEVKNVIEKSKNSKGELEFNNLLAGLNKSLSKTLSESDLGSLLLKNNISVEKRLFSAVNSKMETGDLISVNNRYLTNEMHNEIKQKIETLLKEKSIPEEDIKSIIKNLDHAFAKKTLEQGSAKVESAQKNQHLLNVLTEEKQIISRVLGDSVKEDIAAFLKKRGSSEKDIRSFLDSFSLNVKKANMGLGDTNLKSSMLNDKISALLKNDQFLTKSDQGNLKLNLSEMIKLAEKRDDVAQLIKTEIKTQSAPVFKNVSAIKNQSDVHLKETQQISSLNISQEKEIKNIGKINQSNNASMPHPLPKVVDKIMIMIRAGEFKSRLHITPPDLGKLDIDLTLKNGHINANLSTENALIKEIIEANLNQLKQQLSNQGLTVDKFDVMVGLNNGKREESNTWADGKNGKGPGRNTGTKSVSPEEIAASQPLNNNLISDTQIDVHV